jgi:hypothetical protein
MSGSLYAALGQRDQVEREDGDTILGTATPASASVNTSGNGLQYALLGLAGVLVGALIHRRLQLFGRVAEGTCRRGRWP